MGRPLADIDWVKVDDLLVAGCSGADIAGYIGINPNTLYERCMTDHGITFSVYSQQKYAKGESLLKVKQYEKALRGDNMMLVWLGKNRLKQRDKPIEDEQHENLENLAKSLASFLGSQVPRAEPIVRQDLASQ